MKRSNFLKALGILPAALMLPKWTIGEGGQQKFKLKAAGFWGMDGGLHLGFSHKDEELFLTVRPSTKRNPTDDGVSNELAWNLRDNMKRFKGQRGEWVFPGELEGRKKKYYRKMQKWCERLAEYFKSVS